MLISLWLWSTPYSNQTLFRGPHQTLRPVSTLEMNKQRNFTRNQINFFVSFDHHLKFRQKIISKYSEYPFFWFILFFILGLHVNFLQFLHEMALKSFSSFHQHWLCDPFKATKVSSSKSLATPALQEHHDLL